jgi:hypothetical protein
VSFYIVKHPVLPGQFRIEDDGATIPYLESCGVDFSTETRTDAFASLLTSHSLEFDEDEVLLHSVWTSEEGVPSTAMRFLSFMLRINDFLLLTKDKVASTFKEDAAQRIIARIGDRAAIDVDKAVSNQLSDTIPDMVIRAKGRTPVALFFGSSPQRVNDAIFLQMQALYEVGDDLQVIALLERESVINRDLRRRGSNRLAAMPIYEGDEKSSIDRIEREALGSSTSIH